MAQDPQDKTRVLYDAVSKDYDIGSFDEFRTKLQDPTKRKAFYEGVGSEYELGSYGDFEGKIGIKKKELSPSGSGVLPSKTYDSMLPPFQEGMATLTQPQVSKKPAPKDDRFLEFGEPSLPTTTPTKAVKPIAINYDAAVERSLKGRGIDKNNPNYKKEFEKTYQKVRDNELVGHKNSKGEDVLLRGEGFGQSLLNTVANSVKATKDAIEINTIKDPQELVNYFAANPVPELESKPAGIGGELGELLGGVAKPAALLTANVIPGLGTSLMASEAYYTASARQKRELYERGIQEGLTPIQSAQKAMEAAPMSALPEGAMAMALGTNLKGLGNTISKAAQDGFTNALKNSVKSVGRIAAGGAATEGASAGLQAASGYKVSGKEAMERMLEGGGEWGKMDAAFKILGMAGAVPKHLLAASKELISEVPKELREVYTSQLPPEQANKINEQLSNYEAAKEKVKGLVPEENMSTFAGLVEKRNALEKSKEGKSKALTEPIDNEIKSIDSRLSEMQRTGKVNEIDDVTGETIEPTKSHEELKKPEREGIVVPKEYGVAEVVENGEGENKTFKPKASYIVKEGGLEISKPIQFEETKTYTDKDKAQKAADEALAKHYYENAMPETDKPIGKEPTTLLEQDVKESEVPLPSTKINPVGDENLRSVEGVPEDYAKISVRKDPELGYYSYIKMDTPEGIKSKRIGEYHGEDYSKALAEGENIIRKQYQKENPNTSLPSTVKSEGIKNEFTGGDTFYHGTNKNFEKFEKITKAGQDASATEQPIFLSEDKDFADANARGTGSRTLSVKVKNGNFLDFRKDLFNDKAEYGSYDKLYNSLSDTGKKIYDAIDNGEIDLTNTRFSDYDAYDVFSKKLSTGDYDFIEIKPFKEWLIKNGYDGVFLKEHPNERATNLAVFNTGKLEIQKQNETIQDKVHISTEKESTPITEVSEVKPTTSETEIKEPIKPKENAIPERSTKAAIVDETSRSGGKMGEGVSKPKEPSNAQKEQQVKGNEEGIIPPTEPPITDQSKPEKPEFGNKAILKRLVESENIKPEIRERFKENLKYKVKSHEEARAVAKDLIKEYDIEQAVELAEAGKFHGDVNSMIFGEALDQLYRLEQEAKTPQEKAEIASKWADVAIRYDEAGRSGGRFISAIGDFYKKSPLGIKLKEEANRNEAFKEWFKNKESGFKEVWEAIKEEPEFKDIVSKEVQEQLKKERTETRQKRRKNIEDFFDKAKFKGDATYATIIPPTVINGGIEAMKQAFLAGESIANAVTVAIDHISNEIKDWDKEKFRKEWEDKLKGLGEEKVNTIRRDKRIEYLKKELERIRKRSPKEKVPESENKRKVSDEEQILLDEIEAEQTKWDAEKDAAREAANDYQKMETERNRQLKRVGELNEKIETLRKGKLPETKVREPKIDTPEIEQLKAEKALLEKAVRESIAQENKMKDLEVELKRLKDRKEKEPKPEKVREITEQERQIRDEIDAERKAWDIEKNVVKLQEELQRVKDRQKKATTPKEKRELTDTEKSILDEIKLERQKWAKEVEPERRVREALKAAQKSLEEYERRITERDISKKESTTPETPQLKQLREKRDAKRKEYEEMKKKMTAPTKEELDAKNKDRILERFRKKLKGLSDKEKETVIRKSFKKLVENGALEYEDFKQIIKETLGLGELSEAERAKIDQYVKDINSVQDLAEKARTDRTDESLKQFREGAKRAEKSATALGEIVYNKPKIINRLTSIMQLNTLGIPSLINNPIFNIFNQLFVRFPKAVQLTLLDRLIQVGGKVLGKDLKPNTDVVSAQIPFFKGVGEGTAQSAEQMLTGLTNKDYFQKEVYTSQIRPFTSLKDLWDFGRSSKFGNKVATTFGLKEVDRTKRLSGKQIADKAIQGTIGIPAEIVARSLNIGDKPQRFATEKAAAKVIANQYGLKGMDEKLFMEFPKQEAYRLEKGKGLSDEAAMKRAEEIEKNIISEGEESTFQQDNIVNEMINAVGKAYDKVAEGKPPLEFVGQAGKVFKTMNLPFVKIPLNAFWSYFNLVNPEIAMMQSAAYGAAAAYKKAKGIDGAARDFEQSKKWLAHASTGMGLLALTGTLAAKGIVTGDNTADDAKKEREGEKYYEQQHSMDMNKLWAYLNGQNPEDAETGLKVDLKWFGVLGNAANLQANKYEEMKPEQRQEGIKLMGDILGDLQKSTLEVFQSGVFSNAAGLANAFDRGGVYTDSYLTNLINMGTNVVHPAMFSQISRAKLPYEYTTKADTFLDQIKNNMSARSEWGRKLMNKYPPSRLSIWGDEMKRSDDWALRWFSMSRSNKDAFAKPLYDDYKKTGNTAFFPPSVKPTLNDQKLTPSQQRQLETLVGQRRKALTAPFINDMATLRGYSEKYSKLSEKEKLDALEDVYETGRKQGEEAFIKMHPQFAEKDQKETSEERRAKRHRQQFKKSLN